DPNEFFMVVYDRWGNKVYETDIFEPNVDCKACTEGAWDGSNQGSVNKGDEVLENGVYTWFCEFKDWNGIIFNKQGTVHLIR
ncbi:MAG: gliding motility-associated C-terminal domain-containing protein, partial [Bacteroidales bacterium]|nr:gliding motility-associated C-terminal domain-containing protein [Bacteroidales bacterium]